MLLVVVAAGTKGNGSLVPVWHVAVTEMRHVKPLLEGAFSSETKNFWLSNQQFDQMSGGLFGH